MIPQTARLTFRPVSIGELDAFHALVQDEHVRRYLMDGESFPREWAEARVLDSEALFAKRGVGLWLVREAASGRLVGFCGFLVISSVHEDPQLVYAMFESFTGQGYATEMAQAAIEHATRQAGFPEIIAAVDEPNIASCRVLEKLGFERSATTPGPFGHTLVYQLRP